MSKKPCPAAELYNFIQKQTPKIKPQKLKPKPPTNTTPQPHLWLTSYATGKQSGCLSRTVTATFTNDKWRIWECKEGNEYWRYWDELCLMPVIYSNYEWNKWEEDKIADKKVDTQKIKFRISHFRVVIRLVCHTCSSSINYLKCVCMRGTTLFWYYKFSLSHQVIWYFSVILHFLYCSHVIPF